MTLKFQPKIHSEVINMCTDGGTMENCHEFQEVVVLLNTANDFVKEFSKIRYKGGSFRCFWHLSMCFNLSHFRKRAIYPRDIDSTWFLLETSWFRQRLRWNTICYQL